MPGKKYIKVCNYHREYLTPLIPTFAFRYKEYWCPYCAETYALMETREVNSTPELEGCREKYREASSEFLHATGILICIGTMWKGERILPEQLPQEEKDRLKAIRDKGWETGIEIETVTNNQK